VTATERLEALKARHAGLETQIAEEGRRAQPDETIIHTLKKEKLNRRSWPTRKDARSAVFAWIEGWYNRRRLHSTLGQRSPEQYENRTLSEPGASLAASRLAHSSIIIKETAA